MAVVPTSDGRPPVNQFNAIDLVLETAIINNDRSGVCGEEARCHT